NSFGRTGEGRQKTTVRKTRRHGGNAFFPISRQSISERYRLSFPKEGIFYFRYSDDILLFADNLQELARRQEQLNQQLSDLDLALNPDKLRVYKPGEALEFLGFCYRNGEIDLSDHTIAKTKSKIKRKSEALRRWPREKNLSGEKAAIGFVRAMNRKFFGNTASEDTRWEDFTWNRWFFSNLTVDTGLREIDAYMQEYIRYTVTGRHYKGNYRIRYETMKKWGYRSLVHEFWNWKQNS
ncbi:MAG: hypothetical protein K2G20_01860, partial [Lachnospiraceae bacterium]|nr:hypothetical protein [Lachnospiraceae bacterium]